MRRAPSRSAQQRREKEAREIAQIREHPAVKQVMQHFPDARIAAVRPVAEPAPPADGDRRAGRVQRGRDQLMKNFAEMMKQAQQLQGRMADMQAEMERTLIEGRSGGGMVVVTLNGKGDMAGSRSTPLCSSRRRPRSSRI